MVCVRLSNRLFSLIIEFGFGSTPENSTVIFRLVTIFFLSFLIKSFRTGQQSNASGECIKKHADAQEKKKTSGKDENVGEGLKKNKKKLN